MKFKRIFLIVIDSLGIGATKDADRYGDGLANSLMNSLDREIVNLPNFKMLGLFNLVNDEQIDKTAGFYTKATPNYKMKCSIVSMYELMGSICNTEYKKFDIEKVDKKLIDYIETEIDRRIIIAKETKQSEILENYGVKHMKSGDVIVSYEYYNLTIYSHESVIPLKNLVKIGHSIINILKENNIFINKIIVKTFTGNSDKFIINKEYGTIPFPDKEETILSKLKKNGYKVITIGKCSKIFNQNEITNICYTENDLESAKRLIKATTFDFEGLCVTNLSELNYCGHSRNVHNYLKVLKNFDNLIPLIVKQLNEDDLVIFTSDQGNDPTYSGDDHTREKVPVLAFTPKHLEGGELPYLQTLADVGATIADNFNIECNCGTSFLKEIK